MLLALEYVAGFVVAVTGIFFAITQIAQAVKQFKERRER